MMFHKRKSGTTIEVFNDEQEKSECTDSEIDDRKKDGL